MDLSPLRKFEILGPDAEALMQATMTRDIRRLAVGQVVYTAMCNETGGMIDDGTVFRLGAGQLPLRRRRPSTTGVWLREQAERLGLNACGSSPRPTSCTTSPCRAPRSREILHEIVWTPPTQTAARGAASGSASRSAASATRTGSRRRVAHRLHGRARLRGLLPPERRARRSGRGLGGRRSRTGIKPLGLDALDMLRIEAGLIFAGYEFDDQVDPFEAGIGFTVTLDKEDDFVGRDALIERKAHPQRTLVGPRARGQRDRRARRLRPRRPRADRRRHERHAVAVLRKNIALCRIAVQHAELGTEVEVGKLDGHQKRIPATVVRHPFYDPEKLRPRS